MKRIRNYTWTVLVLLAAMAIGAACGSKTYEAQAINEATDRCVICNMAIKDDQYATQIITKDGQSLKFDDLGCMNQWKTENGTDTVGAAFVRDYTNSKWLKYEDAYYVYEAQIKTPMAYGIVSFESEKEAEAFIAEHGSGTLMKADDLAQHSWAVNRDMMDMDGHSHDADGHADGESGHGDGEAGHSHDGEAGQDHEGKTDEHGGDSAHDDGEAQDHDASETEGAHGASEAATTDHGAGSAS